MRSGVKDLVYLMRHRYLKDRAHWDHYRTWGLKEVTIWDDLRRGYVYDEELELFRRVMDPEADGLVLNIACGKGRFAELFLKDRCINLDFSPKFIEAAKGTGEDRMLILADAFHPPFRSDLFSVVFSCRLLHHQKDPRALLNVCATLIKGDGTLMFDITHRSSLPQLVGELLGSTLRGQNIQEMELVVEKLELEVQALERAFFLPAILYGFFPPVAARVLDRIFSKILPARSFWRVGQ